MSSIVRAIVGYFLDESDGDIPRVLPPAVRIDDDFVSIGAPDVEEPVIIPFEQFKAVISEGGAVRLEPIAWDSGKALLLTPQWSTPKHLPYARIDKTLREFVAHCRNSGASALSRERQSDAMRWFDRARRVSNEPDDYVRVWALEATKNKSIWLDWLRVHAPGVKPLRRAQELGLVSTSELFPRKVALSSRSETSCA